MNLLPRDSRTPVCKLPSDCRVDTLELRPGAITTLPCGASALGSCGVSSASTVYAWFRTVRPPVFLLAVALVVAAPPLVPLAAELRFSEVRLEVCTIMAAELTANRGAPACSYCCY